MEQACLRVMTGKYARRLGRLAASVLLAGLAAWLAACGRRPSIPTPALVTATMTGPSSTGAAAATSSAVAPLASPGPASTPAATAASEACLPEALEASVVADAGSGAVRLVVRLQNMGAGACTLHGPPDVRLVDGAGTALAVVPNLTCFDCLAPEPGSGTPTAEVAPEQMATTAAGARARIFGQVNLPSGESASVMLVWQNWCAGWPAAGVAVQLALPGGGSVTAPVELGAGPDCEAAGAPSTVVISEYMR